MQPNTTESTPLQVTSNPPPVDNLGLAREAFGYIQDGSTAILIAGAIVVWFLRGQVTKYIESAVTLNSEVVQLARSARTWFDQMSEDHKDQADALDDIRDIVTETRDIVRASK